MMKILTKNVKTVLLSVLCLVMLVSTFVATTLFTNKAHAVDESTKVWVDDFESFTQDAYLAQNAPYTVGALDNVQAVADPTNAENMVIKMERTGLFQYDFGAKGYATFKDGPLVFSADYYLSEDQATQAGGLSTTFFYANTGAAQSQIPYTISNTGRIKVAMNTIDTGVDVPIGEWFTLVLYMENFNASQMYMITKDGVTCVASGFAAILAAAQPNFINGGLYRFRIGVGGAQAWLVDNISFKYGLDSSHLSMQTTEGEVGIPASNGWDFLAEEGKTRTMQVTGLTDTQSVVGIFNNQFTDAGSYNVSAIIKDTSAATNLYSDSIYYWKKVNVVSIDENTKVWADDFESFTQDAYLAQNAPYTVNALDNVQAVADPTDAENTVLKMKLSPTVANGFGLIQYDTAANGCTNFKYGPLVFSADYYLSEDQATQAGGFSTTFFYANTGAAQSQIPYTISNTGRIKVCMNIIDTGVDVPVGEWFTLVLRIDSFKDKNSQLFMITKDGVTCVARDFDAIHTNGQQNFIVNGLYRFRIGVGGTQEWLVDNISFKYGLDTSALSMQTTDGEVGTPTALGWDFTAEKGKNRTMEVTGLTDTQSVVGMYNNQLNTIGEYNVLAVIKDTAATNPYNDTIYYWKKVNVIGQTIDMSGVSFESVSFDYDGQLHKIEITGELPAGVEVTYENNEHTEVGEYTAVAKFTVDTDVYNAIPDMTATITITDDNTVTEVAVDKTSGWAGDVITSNGLNKNGEESQSDNTIQWYKGRQTSLWDATIIWTEIEGATEKTYTITSADEGYLLKVVYTAGSISVSSRTVTVNRILDDDFESYPVNTIIIPQAINYSYQTASNIQVIVDPTNSENQVVKLKGTDLIQTRGDDDGAYTYGISKFKDGAFVISLSLYLNEEAAQAEGHIAVSLFYGTGGVTSTQPFMIKNGEIILNHALEAQVNAGRCPVGEWFTLTYHVSAFDGVGSMWMTKANGETTCVYYGAKPIIDSMVANFKAEGVNMVRIGVTNQEWIIDNFSIKHAIDTSAFSMQASTGEAGTATDLGWDFVYTGTERTMSVTGKTTTQEVVSITNNDVTNAGCYDIVAVIKDSSVDTRMYSDTVYYWRRINVSKASYNMEGITFEGATYDWEHDKTYNIVIGGELPQGLTVEYTCNGEPFTGTTVGGVFEITATFVSSDPANYNVPEAKTATLTVNQRSYDMSNVTFVGKTVTYNGEVQTIAVSDNLPDGVTVKCYIGSDEFTGATNAGTYTIVAKFSGSIDYMPIADMTATLVIEKANYDMSGVTFVDKTATYNGSAIEFVASNLPVGVTAKYYVNEDEVTEFINAGEYNVTVKFESSDANYNAPSETKTAKLTINKADVDMSGITFEDKTVYFDGLAKKLEITGTLPSCVSVEYKVNGETFNGTMEEGEFEVTAVFTLTNENNYNALTVTSLTATLKVEKRAYDMSGISFESASFVYDSQSHKIEITGELPEGVEVNYIGNNKVTVGEYTVTAQFVGDSTYADIPDMTATLTITKATIDMSGVTFADVSVEYDGEVHSITISGTLPQGVSVTYEGNAKSEVGEYTVTAKFALDDTANFNAIADMTAKLTITEKASSAGCMSSVTASAGVAALITMFGAAALIRKGKKD